MKAIARGACLTLPLFASGAMAELSCRFDAALGNALSPPGLDIFLAGSDPRGIGALHEGPGRSPAGLLYATPSVPPATTGSVQGWSLWGGLEAGALGGDADERAALFREYKDIRNGLLLNSFGLHAEKPGEAKYMSLFGGGVGRDDQYYGLLYGRYNDYKLRLFLEDTPHVLATDARPIWQGLGSGSLTLPAGLTPGRGDRASIQAAVDATGATTVELARRKAGIAFDKTISDTLSGYLRYTAEKREGTRPFGGAFFFPTPPGVGASMETVEPIDYMTHDAVAGLRYADDLRQLNVAASASVFRNRIDTLTWENPFDVSLGPTPNAANIQRGRFDLYPDNEAYHLKADYAQAFPSFHRSRFTASASAGSMRQDDALIAPAVNSGTAGRGVFQYPLENWNTTEALGQKSAGASIDTVTASLGYSLVPVDKLTLRARARYEETRNNTDYTALNPLTGQYGYPSLDGARGTIASGENGFYTPGGLASQSHYRSIPFDHRKLDYGVVAEYPIARRTQVSGEYERQEFHRDHRERDRTWEDRLRVAVNSRVADGATLGVSFEHSDRRGSQYNYDPYREFFTASLPGYPDPSRVLPHTLADLRKHDLADRRRDTLKARFNMQLRQDLDGFLSVRLQESDYPASYGRTGRDARSSVGAEINYQPAPLVNAYLFYSHEASRMQQAGIGNRSIPGSSPDAGGNNYPLANAWRVDMRERNDVAGFGVKIDFPRLRLDFRYAYADGRSPISYEAASQGASTLPLAGELAGAFPDITFRQHLAETSLVFPVGGRLSARIYHRYEDTRLADWHYTGLAGNLLQGPVLYLDAGPQGYRASVIGVFLQYRL